MENAEQEEGATRLYSLAEDYRSKSSAQKYDWS